MDAGGKGLYTTSNLEGWESECPYGQPGDRLWVREAWRSGRLADPFPPRDMTPHVVWYEADGAAPEATNGKLRPSMFMPRWASRIELEIVSVRVERLNDCSEADAKAEGCSSSGWQPSYSNPDNAGGDESISAKDAFADLWESINGAGSWAANPWVWVVEFKRVMP